MSLWPNWMRNGSSLEAHRDYQLRQRPHEVHMADDPQAFAFDWPRVPARNSKNFGAGALEGKWAAPHPDPEPNWMGPPMLHAGGPNLSFEWAGTRAKISF